MARELTWERVAALLSRLPETECHPPPSGHFPHGVVRVRGKVIAYPAGGSRGSPPDALPDEEFMFVKVAPAEREALSSADPLSFFTIPHYDSAPASSCGREPSTWTSSKRLLIEPWRVTAPKRLVTIYDHQQEPHQNEDSDGQQ